MRRAFAATAALLLFAAPASASPRQDGVFLLQLSEVGIGYDSASTAIIAAHEVCAALDAGATFAEVADALSQHSGLTKKGAVVFAAISVSVYCGQHGDAVRPNSGGNAPKRVAR